MMEQQEKRKSESDSPPSHPPPQAHSLAEAPKQFYVWSVSQEQELLPSITDQELKRSPNSPIETDVEALKR